MNRIHRVPMLLISGVVLSLVLVALGGCSTDTTETEQPAETVTEEPAEVAEDVVDAEQVFLGACTTCHDAQRIYLMQTEATDWAEIVTKMETAHGAELTAAEKEAVIAYLESRQPEKAETVIQGACTTCHDVSNLWKSANGYQWTSVLDRMVTAHGAALSPEDQQLILDYLGGNQ